LLHEIPPALHRHTSAFLSLTIHIKEEKANEKNKKEQKKARNDTGHARYKVKAKKLP